MALISVAKINDPGGGMPDALRRVLEPFAGQLDLEGTRVLIKPNLVEPVPCTTGQTTKPALVEALVQWLKKQGASEIAIGEGPSFFQPRSALTDCFLRTGMVDVARRQKVRWILFDNEPFRELRDFSPATPPVFHISAHAFSWDHIVNVPVPKPHYLTTVSNAMKNLKGFIKREEKPSFHCCGHAVFIGNCTPAAGGRAPRLASCPPAKEEVAAFLEKHLLEDTLS